MRGLGMGLMSFFDPTIILLLVGTVLSLVASWRVSHTFNKYSSVRSTTGMTGAQAATMILRSQGIFDVKIQPVKGKLTDHYDPKNRTLNLSEDVYNTPSVAAVGVAAHECGHAIQDNVGYQPLRFRTAFVPVANFGSRLSWPLIMLGIIFGGFGGFLLKLGIWMFLLVVIFQLVTLPVEYNASGRAVKLVGSLGILQDKEVSMTKKVLSAAALTYVAAAAVDILQLLRLVILFGGRRDNGR